MTPVWCNRQGDVVLINTMRGWRKEKNVRADPRVSLLAYDPRRPTHNIEIRGRVVEMTEQRQKERRVIVTIEPIKVSADAFFR